MASTCTSSLLHSGITEIFFLKFKTEERVLRVNKSKITGENTFF